MSSVRDTQIKNTFLDSVKFDRGVILFFIIFRKFAF